MTKMDFQINAKELKGTSMLLEASVTSTTNIVMAACLAKGKTTISGLCL